RKRLISAAPANTPSRRRSGRSSSSPRRRRGPCNPASSRVFILRGTAWRSCRPTMASLAPDDDVDPYPMTSFPRCDATAAWAALRGHYEAHGRDLDLREAFARDPARFERFGVEAPELFCDLSKNLVDAATLHFLADLARECGVEAQRDAMLAGEAINVTEGRAVLHTALRAPPGAAPFSDEVQATREAMLAFAEAVRARAEGGARPLRHVVNIG